MISPSVADARLRSALRVYRSASLALFQPYHAISCVVVAPRSAARVADAFRKQFVVHRFGSPASLQTSRNQFPNPAAVKGLPCAVTKNIR
jgi:hypothetical protein